MKTCKLILGHSSFLYLFAALFLLAGTKEGITSGTLYINQDFENTSFPPSGWTVVNTSTYDWIRTTYASGYGNGVSSAVADFYDYSSGNFELITTAFAPSTSGDSLVFDHAYATGSSENDRLEIYSSSNNGSTWNLLISLAGGVSGPLRTAPPTYDLFVPTSSQWATKAFALPVGTNKIKFTGVTAYGNNLYLDNVKIGVPFSNDAGMSSISQPKWGIKPQIIAPKAAVKNYGTAPASFQVTMTINPGGYTNTQNVSNLLPGQSQTVTFLEYNFASVGNYTLKSFTTRTGDLNPVNDTIANTLVVTTSPRNTVLELCTGTWCQWCPCGDDEAHNVSVAYPNSVILSYHGAGSDPWRVFKGSGIISALGFAGYPSGLVDRRLGGHNGWGSFFTDTEYRLSKDPAGTVEITPTSTNYNTTSRQLTVNLDAKALATLSGQYKVNYIITENNLVYPQTGNSYCPGNSAAVHNWVVRNIVNTMTGDNVNTGTWNQGQVYPLTFTTTIDPGWNAANCGFNVMIFKENGSLSVSEVQQGFKSAILQTGISQNGTEYPSRFELEQNYPNPFNPTTNNKFSLPKDGNASLKIYDVNGKVVATFLNGFVKAGSYNAQVDGTGFTSGVYFYTLNSGDLTETRKMVLLK
jgi:hypothetical protein